METKSIEYVCWFCGCPDLTLKKVLGQDQWECGYCHIKAGIRDISKPKFLSIFADDLQILEQQRLQRGERILYKFTCSFSFRFGYVIITSSKLFGVSFVPDKGSLFTLGGNRAEYIVKDTGIKAWLADNDQLTKKEIDSRRVEEVPLINILSVNLNEHRDNETKWFTSVCLSLVSGVDTPYINNILFHPVNYGVDFYHVLNGLNGTSTRQEPITKPIERTKTCIACEIELPGEANFCWNCGKPLEKDHK